MKRLGRYVYAYFAGLDKTFFLFISLVLSGLVYVNYNFKINSRLLSAPGFGERLLGFYGLYLLVFGGTVVAALMVHKRRRIRRLPFLLIVLLAPLIFAAKVAFRIDDYFLQWPLKALIVTVPVMIVGWVGKYERPLFGLQFKGAELGPYFKLIVLMLPLLALAGLMPSFQQVYPKLKLIGEQPGLLKTVIFELSYGLDFFTIELFFRGFLIIAFIKYLGKDAILAMAVFYCVIHFGKPLAECISSYFGGLILGAIVYNTRSIWGGLVVHLGVAWGMEIAASFTFVF